MEPHLLIRLDVIGGARVKKVRVRLSSDDYERAWSAHGENAVMVVTGRLEREGQYYWMYEPSEIQFEHPIVDDGEHR